MPGNNARKNALETRENAEKVRFYAASWSVGSGIIGYTKAVPASLFLSKDIPVLQKGDKLFHYYLSMARGLDVDKPRNLAKSVTVE